MSYILCTVDGIPDVNVLESDLKKQEGGHETDAEIVKWVEYYLNDQLVHRSAHVHLKQGLGSLMEQGAFN